MPGTLDEKRARLRELQERAEARRHKDIELARNDYEKFAEFVLRDQTTDEKIKLADIHREWIRHIQFSWSRGLIPFILAPYGHGKTSIIGYGLPLFLIGKDPTIRIKMISATDNLALSRVNIIRSYIEESSEYKEVFPHIKPETMTRHRITVARQTKAADATVEALGALATAIGGRADLLVIDDINDAKNTIQQPRMREHVWRNYTGIFLSRLEPYGRVVIIATRWHDKDLAGNILADPDMREEYAFLVQRISEDFTSIEQETIIGTGAKQRKVRAKKTDVLEQLEAGLFS